MEETTQKTQTQTEGHIKIYLKEVGFEGVPKKKRIT